jgi:hypothetical protein
MTKSATFGLRRGADDFIVEVDYNGDLKIIEPQVDMEYEVAFTAMGGNESAAILLMRNWQEEPILVALRFLMPVGYQRHAEAKQMIALDWVDHVLPIYEAIHPAAGAIARKALKAARGHAGRGAGYPKKLENEVRSLSSAAYTDDVTTIDGWYVVKSFCSALAYELFSASKYAATAAANAARSDLSSGLLRIPSSEFDHAYKTERLWQIRRMIDVAEYLAKPRKRKYSAKNWLPLGATL